jgi:uncharacterized protein YprB with RNaseH-like and TPR domain
VDLRSRIAALTGSSPRPEAEKVDTSRLRERLQRLGEGAPKTDADLVGEWRAEADRAAAEAEGASPASSAPEEPTEKPKRRRSPPLESIEGATVVGERDYLRIDRPLDDEVRDAALPWLHLWAPRHVHVLTPDGRLAAVDPRRALFIDTETTGLGGASSLVFLIGAVRWLDGRLHLRQYFLFGPPGERAMMADFLDFVSEFDFLVSYNGRAFDVRALCDRLILSGLHHGPPMLEGVPHVDLLHPARRIWRHALRDCRLVTIEEEVLRRPRGDDIDGMQIPMIYYNYLRHGRLREVHKVIRHNEWDTVSLALLGAAMMRMLTDPRTSLEAPAEGADARRVRRLGEQLVGLGSLHMARGDAERAEEALAHGLESASPTSRYMARKRLAALHKKRGEVERALPLWTAMLEENVLGEAHAYTELAKYLEHRRRDYPGALAVVERALTDLFEGRRRPIGEEWDGLQQRKQRLEQALRRR